MKFAVPYAVIKFAKTNIATAAYINNYYVLTYLLKFKVIVIISPSRKFAIF